MDTAAFRQHFFFDARCDGQAVSFAALILHPRRQEVLTSRFLQELTTPCFLRSDGQAVACKNLMETAAFRQHFFLLMPGVIARGILQALMQHSHPMWQEISDIQVSAAISTLCFSEVMVNLLPAKI